MRRLIPNEDIKILKVIKGKLFYNDDYKDVVFCKCGLILYFKNRESYEPVKIVCPECGFEILYG